MNEKRQRRIAALMLLLGGCFCLPERILTRIPGLKLLNGVSWSWIGWAAALAGLLGLLQSVFTARRSVASLPEDWRLDAAILLLTAVSLGMLIHSGYFWDDAVNSTAYLAEKKDSISTGRHVLDFMMAYLKLGRINVLSAYYYFFFYLENAAVYKALILLLILGNQLILRVTLQEFGFSKGLARLGMLLLPLLLQTRVYQDPVSGFYGLMQVLTAEMLLCALFLSRGLRLGRKRDTALSLLFFTAGLMTYEVCFPFLAMVGLLMLSRSKNFGQAVKRALPYGIITLLALGAVIFVRKQFVTESTYAGVAFSLDLPRILRTAFYQITAGLPLSFYTAAQQSAVLGQVYPAESFMNYHLSDFLKAVAPGDLLLLAAFLLCLSSLRGQLPEKESYKTRDVLILGGSFALLPSMTVAISDRYQGQLGPGLGYLPVYMQYFGVVILLVVLCSRLPRGLRTTGWAAAAVVLLLNVQNNRAVTEILNRHYSTSRNAGEAALRSGILDFLPEDAKLIAANSRHYLWESNWNGVGLYREFYGNWSRHLPESIGNYSLLDEVRKEALEQGALPDEEGYVRVETADDNFWLISYAGDTEQGLTVLGHLRSAEAGVGDAALRNPCCDRVLYFISGRRPEQAAVRYIDDDGVFRELRPAEQSRVRETARGILYGLPEEESIVWNALSVERQEN